MRLIDYKEKIENDKENINLKIEYLKACYNIFVKADGYKNEIRDLAWYEGVSVIEILDNAKTYIVNNLGFKEEEFYNIIHLRELKKTTNYKIRDSKYNNLIIELMGIDDRDKIIKIIDDANIRTNHLKQHIYDFIMIYYPGRKYLIKVLREKVDVYLEYKNNKISLMREEQFKDKKEKRYDQAKIVIDSFIDSNFYRVIDFCNNYDFTKKEFVKYMEVIKVNNNVLYQKYLEEIERRKIIFDKDIVSKIKQMVYFIENGINDNVGVRSFDIIDYYQFIGLDMNELYWYLNNYEFSALEIKKIRALVDKNRGLKEINSRDYDLVEGEIIRDILKDVQEYGAKKDNKGLLIPGTGRVIQLDEKEKIIEFLRKIEAPLTMKNYKIACRRYISGRLLFDKNEVKEIYIKKR